MTAPSSQFHLQNEGVVYVIHANCGQPIISPTNNTINGTKLGLTNILRFPEMYTAVAEVTLPAGSHDYADALDSDIIQQCPIRIISGLGNVQFSFVVDEWARFR